MVQGRSSRSSTALTATSYLERLASLAPVPAAQFETARSQPARLRIQWGESPLLSVPDLDSKQLWAWRTADQNRHDIWDGR
jgi:hypothetical protein